MLRKISQSFSFSNEEEIRSQFGKLRERELTDYLSIMAQIHKDLEEDFSLSLNDAISENVSQDFAKNKINSVINGIGEFNFRNYDFSLINQKIKEVLENKEEVSEEESGPKQETLSERITRVKSLDFSSINNEEVKGEVERLLKNLDFFAGSFRLSSGKRKQSYYEALIETMDSLDEIYENKDLEEYVSEDENEDGPADAEEKDLGGDSDKDNDNSEEDEEEGLTTYEGGSSYSSKLEDSDSYNLSYVKSISELEDLNRDNLFLKFFKEDEEGNLSFDRKVYLDLYNNFLSEIDSIYSFANEEASRGNFRKSQKNIVRFNDLMFSIKTIEKDIISELISISKQGLVSSDDYRNLYSNVKSSLVTLKISNNQDLFDSKIFFTLAFLSKPSLLEKLQFSKDDDSFEIYSLKSEDPLRLKQAALDILNKTYYSKFRKLLDSNNIYYKTSMRNFLGEFSVSMPILRQNVEREFRGTPSYERKYFCSTCSKEITYNYTKSMSESSSVSNQKNVRSFYVPWYSVFKSAEGGVMPITLNDLRGEEGEKRFPPPDPSNYRTEIEKKIVSEYKGLKSWKEIEELIYSNDRNKHQEGVHRRSAALKSLGALNAGSLSTKSTNSLTYLKINNLMNECPFSSDDNSVSCGLSLTQTGGESVFSLQPGEKMSFDDWDGNNIENEDLRAEALKRKAGGFKFSKVMFGCPAHWDSFEAEDASQKHSLLAVSKSGGKGSEGFVGPIDGTTGFEKELEDGTSSYLVCGANTSISSFNRDSGSEGYIVSILEKIRNKNEEAYVKVMDYLARNGVDPGDLIYLSTKVEDSLSEVKASNSRKERLDKIAELLVKNAVARMSDDLYEHLKDIELVCPHGHKFTIAQSVDFDNANFGLHIGKSFSSYKNLFGSQGLDNIKKLVEHGIIVLAPDYMLVNKEIYEPNKVQKVEDIFIQVSEDGEVKNYVFNTSIKLRRSIFRYLAGAKSSIETPTITSVEYDSSVVSSLRMFDIESSGSDDQKITVEGNFSESYVSKLEESKRASYIPGLYSYEDAETNIHDRVEPLSKALKASLKVIMTWTKGVANSDLSRVLHYSELGKIEEVSSKIAKSVVDSGSIISSDYQVVVDNGEKRRVRTESDLSQESKDRFSAMASDELSRDIKYYSFFENAIGKENIANIVSNSIISAIYKFTELEELTEEVDLSEDFNEENISNIVNQELNSNPSFTKILISEYKKKNLRFVKRDYKTKIFLYSYALYMSEILVGLYNTFMRENSTEYIGYDIGLDLSSTDKILDLDESTLDALVTYISNKEFYSVPEEHVKMYCSNVDKLYERLKFALENGKSMAFSPAAIIKSKVKIKERIKKFTDDDKKKNEIERVFDAAFPVKFLNFNDTEIAKRLIPLPVKNKDKYLVPGGLEGTVEENGVIKNELINYDSSKFQIGMTSPKSSKLTVSMTEGDGFVGFHIPMMPPFGSNIVYPVLKHFPVSSLKIMVNVDGKYRLDISSFFERGISDEHKERVRNIRALMKQKYLKYIPAIKREYNDVKKRELIDSLNAFLREMHAEISGIPLNVKTTMSRLAGVVGNYSNDSFATLNLVPPSVFADMVENPYLIFPDYDFKPNEAALKSFYIGAYNLKDVSDIVSKVSKKDFDPEDLLTTSFYSELENFDKKIVNKIDSAVRRGYKESIGKYYDIIPNENEEDSVGSEEQVKENSGSYIGYVFRFLPEMEYKAKDDSIVVKEEDNEGTGNIGNVISTIRNAMNAGLIDGGKADKLLSRIPEFLSSYVEDYAKGDFERNASDADSEYIIKTAERIRQLERIMLSMGFDGIFID